MRDLNTLLLLLSCTTLFWTVAPTAESKTDETSSVCYKSDLSEYKKQFVEAFNIKLAVELTESDVYINCISFNAHQELKSAIVSGGNSTVSSVIDFSCKGGTLFAFNSQRGFNTTESKSCVDCATGSTTGSACVEPCAEECERCYDNATNCECSDFLVYDVSAASAEVEDLHLEGLEDKEIEQKIEKEIKALSSISCQNKCPDDYNTSSHGDPHICYPCGVQFCVKCKGGECKECLPHTHLYHHGHGECLYGLWAEILEVFEEQEHEVEEEEEEKDNTRLQLAISLPIVCVGVILFFIMMSFIAHKRYPHIGETGQKRHRNRPSYDTDEVDLPPQDSVFTPRPTIRLR